MCDSEASCAELTLPAREIIQLGLTPFGKPADNSKRSTNHVTESLQFAPPVIVRMLFERQIDENKTEVEEREAYLTASCHKSEYEEELPVRRCVPRNRWMWLKTNLMVTIVKIPLCFLYRLFCP